MQLDKRENLRKVNINQKDKFGNSMLHIAVYSNNDRIVKLLLKNKADINILNDEYKETPLHYNIDGCSYDLMKLLLKNGANPNNINHYGESVLLSLVKNETYIIFIELLLKYDVNLNIKDNDGCMASQYAYDLDLMDVFNLLIKKGAIYNGEETKDKQIYDACLFPNLNDYVNKS